MNQVPYRAPQAPLTIAPIWRPNYRRVAGAFAALFLVPALIAFVWLLSSGASYRSVEERLMIAAFGALFAGILGAIGLFCIIGFPVWFLAPRAWFHRRTHTIEWSHGVALLRDARGVILGETRSRTLAVQKDNVLHHRGKRTMIAGGVRLSTPDGTWLRVVGSEIIGPWPGLPAEAEYFEIPADAFSNLVALSS